MIKAFEDWIEREYQGESEVDKRALRKLFRPTWQAALRHAAGLCRQTCGEWDVKKNADGTKEWRCPCAQAIERAQGADRKDEG